MGKLFATADLHLGHANIIQYYNRPFRDLDHMNETIIRNWNSRVTKNDTVIVCGDFCFRNTVGGKAGEGIPVNAYYWEERLNGHKIFLRGNHDKNNSLNTRIKSLVILFASQEIYCVHNPFNYNPQYRINFCAHVHEKWKHKIVQHPKYKYPVIILNVGVDVWDFMPMTMDELFAYVVKATEGSVSYDEKIIA